MESNKKYGASDDASSPGTGYLNCMRGASTSMFTGTNAAGDNCPATSRARNLSTIPLISGNDASSSAHAPASMVPFSVVTVTLPTTFTLEAFQGTPYHAVEFSPSAYCTVARQFSA